MSDINIPSKKSSITKNTVYNLLGFTIPLLFAIVLIPAIINKLGIERFGILSLVWVVVGYFSFFDLGFGRALTKIVSEKIGLKLLSEIPSFFWTSVIFIFFISVLFSIIFYFLANYIVFSFLNISSNLRIEALHIFYLLIFILPFITTTASFRGILESYQKFDVLNLIRLLLGLSNFIIPILILFFINSLYYIVLFLVIFRFIIWLLFFYSVLALSYDLRREISFQINLLKPIIKLSSWMTVSNLLIPLMVYSDRILIGAIISTEALTYYATPYEVVTKLWVIPMALTGVLFPNFSMRFNLDKKSTFDLYKKAYSYIFLILLPIILPLVIFSFELLSIWLGQNFAKQSFLVMQLLTVGVFFNCIAQISFSYIEGIGRPDITAKLQLIELPVYLILLFFATKIYGLKGTAFVFMIRMILDALFLLIITRKINDVKFVYNLKLKHIILISIIVLSLSLLLLSELLLKTAFAIILLILLIVLIWNKFIVDADKNNLLTKFKVLKV